MGIERKEEYGMGSPNDETALNPLLDKTSQSPPPMASDQKKLEAMNLDDTGVLIKGSEPVRDKYFLIYFILLLFGLAVLLPWNIFITATAYFVEHKLNTNESMNATYTKDFTFYVGIIGQTTNVVMNLFNILISLGGNPKNRIPYTIMLCSAVIVLHICLAIVDSSGWPLAFFIVTCISVFVMYVATGIMNSCVFYVSALFPMEYINAIILGNNFAGIFTSVTSIISKSTAPNLKLAAIYYFLAAFIVLMLAFVGYFLMHRLTFFRYYTELAEQKKKSSFIESPKSTEKVPYLKIIRQIWPLLFCIWLNFHSTLAIFPVYQLGVVRCSESFFISKHWFQDFVTFLTFNVAVTIGNLIPKLIRKPGPKFIPIPVILRALVVFVFFALCNYKPTKRNLIPVLITNDYAYWAMSALSPLLFGYFTSLMMMYTPKQVAPEHSGAASMIAALTIAIGVMTGLQFSKVLDIIVLL